MNDQLLRTFISLVNFDQKIVSLEKERTLLVSSRQESDEKKDMILKALDGILNQVREFKRDVDEKESQMKVLEQQELDKKYRLENVASVKEYNSIKAEIATINEKQRDHEESLIAAWDKLDAAQKKYVAEQGHSKKAIDELEQSKIDLDKKIEVLSASIDEQEKNRVRLVAAVPAELLDMYENMRGQVNNPVVQIAYNSCSACYYPVSGQDLAALKKGKFLPCKGCYRILYMEEDAGQ
jgi:predicted  nucleic acid-binding Zn-ribbon protein